LNGCHQGTPTSSASVKLITFAASSQTRIPLKHIRSAWPAVSKNYFFACFKHKNSHQSLKASLLLNSTALFLKNTSF